MKKRWGSPLQAAWLAMEAQQVIALRCMTFALGGQVARKEAHRMVSEKTEAAMQAAGLMSAAILRGAPDAGAAEVLHMLRRRVRANRRRLGAP